MTFKIIAIAAGVLALVASIARRKLHAKRTVRVATDQVSSDWLAQARGRADDQP